MIDASSILHLQDLDLLRADLAAERNRARLRKLGFPEPDPAPLERLRERITVGLDRRCLNLYQRAQTRYGRAVAVVRERVCQGCHITLPTSASPPGEDTLTLCESCGRLLYWR